MIRVGAQDMGCGESMTTGTLCLLAILRQYDPKSDWPSQICFYFLAVQNIRFGFCANCRFIFDNPIEQIELAAVTGVNISAISSQATNRQVSAAKDICAFINTHSVVHL